VIFRDEKGKAIPKVIDFGYSTVGVESDIQLPMSPGWNAPEVGDPRECRTFTFPQAKKADIFSAGLVALWLLEEDSIQAHLPNDIRESGAVDARDEIPWSRKIRSLVEKGGFSDHVQKTLGAIPDLNEDQRSGLQNLFNLSLVVATEGRAAEISQLVKTFNHDRRRMADGNTAPFTHDLTLTCKDLDMAQLIFGLRVTDYRVRKHIVSCLRSQADSPVCEDCSTNAAFNLAICYTLGWGSGKSESQAAMYLARTRRTRSDLLTAVEKIITLEDTPLALFNEKTSQIQRDHRIPDFDIGVDYSLVRDSDSMITELEREATDLEETLGPNHTVVFTLKAALSELFRRRGQFAKCEPILKQLIESLEGDVETHGPDHRTTLHMRHDLASLYQDMERIDEATIIQEDVVKKLIATESEDHPFTLNNKQLLSGIYTDAYRLSDAETLILEVLKAQERIFGHDSLAIVHSLMQAGHNLKIQERYPESEQYFLRAKQILLKTSGEDHPDTILTNGHLSVIYSHMNDLEKAEKIMLECKLVHEATMKNGECPPVYLTTLHHLAEVMADSGRLMDAKVYATQAMNYTKELYEVESDQYLSTLEVEIHILRKMEEWRKVVDLQTEHLALSTKVRGGSHILTLNAKARLGEFLIKTNRLEDAEATLVEVLESSKSPEAVANELRNICMSNLGFIHKQQGRPETSAEWYVRGLQISRELHGEDHEGTKYDEECAVEAIEAVALLGDEAVRGRKYEEAERLYRKECDMWIKLYGKNNEMTLTAMGKLALYLWETSSTDSKERREVMAIEEEVLRLTKEMLGADHENTLLCMQQLAATYSDLDRNEDAQKLELEIKRAHHWLRDSTRRRPTMVIKPSKRRVRVRPWRARG